MNLEKIILKKLKPCSDKKRAEHGVGYMNSSFPHLGCDMPTMHRVANEVFAMMNDKTHAQKRRLFDGLWKKSSVFDVLYIPLLYFSSRRDKNDLSDWPVLKSWSTKIDNWGHSDILSSVITELLERYPGKIYPTLKTWNKSKHPWQRRLSLTSLIYYSYSRKKILPVSKILPLVKARLSDKDRYVQKAVGWTLRECGNVYPKETKRFIKNYITQLSSTAFSYSTEKWSKKEKEPLKKARKGNVL